MADHFNQHVDAMVSSGTWYIDTPRLTLRSFNPSQNSQDLSAYEQISSDPRNNVFGATDTPELRGGDLLRNIVRLWDEKQIKFMIILKTNNPTPGMAVAGGELIGDIELNDPRGRRTSSVAGCIHWRHSAQGYGKEAFYAVFKHAFISLHRDQLFLETKAANAAFRAMMERLGLAHLETPGHHWMNRNPPEASVTYTFDQAAWEAARQEEGLRPLTPRSPLLYE